MDAPTEAHPRDPLWYKDAVIYEVHVRAFADSNAHTLFKLQLVSSVCTTNEFASRVQRISNSLCQ